MSRNYALDLVKGLGIIAVVLIHATAPLGYKGIGTFWNYHWYRYGLEFCVPFFFAAAGFLLYQKLQASEDGDQYLWRYSLKILAYYIGATIFYVAFAFVLAASNRLILGMSFRKAVEKIVGNWDYTALLNGTFGWYHLYFLAALFGGCVLMLLLRQLKLDARLVLLVGAGGYLLTLVGYITIDDFYTYGGLLKGFFYLSIGYFVSSLRQPATRWPMVGVLLSMALFYVCSFWVKSMAVVPLALVTYYLAAWCAKYPSVGRDSVLARWGTMSLWIYVLHDASRIIIERVFVYSGVVEYYRSPWYFMIAIPFSFFVPIIIYRFMVPLVESMQTSLSNESRDVLSM